MTRISIREFNKNITKWLNCGKELIVTKNGEDLVVITPVATPPVATLPAKPNVATLRNPVAKGSIVKKFKPLPRICPKHKVSFLTCGCKPKMK